MAKSTVGRVFALFQPRVVVVGWISLYKRNCGIHANKALEMKSFNFCLFYQACETKASRRKHCYSESSFVAWIRIVGSQQMACKFASFLLNAHCRMVQVDLVSLLAWFLRSLVHVSGVHVLSANPTGQKRGIRHKG